MDRLDVQLPLLFLELLILYPVTNRSTLELFRLIYLLSRSKNTSFALIAVIFLPGTVIHEMSHFFAATMLFLPVGEVRIIPEWQGNRIRLGKVTYQKADFVRSVLVGIAPVFGAIFLFVFLSLFHFFPSGNVWLNVAGGYLLYSVSANMFSSKQDLVDLVYMVPLLVVAGAVWYVAGWTVSVSIPSYFLSRTISVLQFVNFCITISLALHIGTILLIRSFLFLLKK